MTIRDSISMILAGAVLAASATVAATADKAAAKDELQGTWTAKVEDKTMTITFSAGKFSAVTPNGKTAKGTYKTDKSKTPAHLDMAITEGEDKIVGKTALCIYEVKGKKLKWCAGDPAKETSRPKKFPETVGGEGDYLYLILDRAK